MAFTNSTARYGSVAMTFHWIIATLLVTNLALGLYFGEFEAHSDPIRFLLIQTHKSIGLTVLVLSIARLAWRFVNPIPPLPSDFGFGSRVLARGTHWLFYVLIIGIPLAGWSMVSSSPLGTPTMYFGLIRWPAIPLLAALPRAEKREYVFTFATVHNLLAYLAIALIVLHVSAALWHHFLRRDTVLRRMLPGTSVAE